MLSHPYEIRWLTAVPTTEASGLGHMIIPYAGVRLETISLRSANLSINAVRRDEIEVTSPRIRVRNTILCAPHPHH